MRRSVTFLFVIFLLVFASSCQKEKEIYTKYIDLELLADWQDFEISADEEIIMRISISTESKIDIARGMPIIPFHQKLAGLTPGPVWVLDWPDSPTWNLSNWG